MEQLTLHLVVAKDRRKEYLDAISEQARIDIMQKATDLGPLEFQEAAAIWLEDKKLHTNKPKTVKSYLDYIARLTHFFAGIPLNTIHIGHLIEYQRQRKDRYAATAVNHDLNTLGQILRKAGLWAPMEPHYRPLPLPPWAPPKVLSETEEENFFALAASNAVWSLAYMVASLTNNTSASGCELRSLQLKHVDLESQPPLLYVPSDRVKNEYRARVTPLNERGAIVLHRILDRAHGLGATQPEHYLFPFRVKRNCFDPTNHASESWLRKQWKKLVDAAVEKKIIRFRITPHCLRYQIITKMLESGVPDQTVMSIVGHVTRQMLNHYSQQRIEAKMRALELINPNRKKVAARARPVPMSPGASR